MLQFDSPSPNLIRPIEGYFYMLLELYQKYRGMQQSAGSVNRIRVNLGNVHEVLQYGLQSDNPLRTGSIQCIIENNHGEGRGCPPYPEDTYHSGYPI